MDVGLAGVCNGTDQTSTFSSPPFPPTPPPPRPTRNRGGLGSQELKSAQEHPGDNPRGALARASVSPLLSLAGALRVSPVPSSPLVGGFFFFPSVFLFLPPPSPSPLGQERTACPQLLEKGGI